MNSPKTFATMFLLLLLMFLVSVLSSSSYELEEDEVKELVMFATSSSLRLAHAFAVSYNSLVGAASIDAVYVLRLGFIDLDKNGFPFFLSC